MKYAEYVGRIIKANWIYEKEPFSIKNIGKPYWK